MLVTEQAVEALGEKVFEPGIEGIGAAWSENAGTGDGVG
jgi:hypothetical protein